MQPCRTMQILLCVCACVCVFGDERKTADTQRNKVRTLKEIKQVMGQGLEEASFSQGGREGPSAGDMS